MSLIVWTPHSGWTAFEVWVSYLEDLGAGLAGAANELDDVTEEALDEAGRREVDGEADDGSGFAWV